MTACHKDVKKTSCRESLKKLDVLLARFERAPTLELYDKITRLLGGKDTCK
ncbi:MAG: hypothetical protein ACTSSI_08495 [Candidatus Helarchaeota archaeon]